VRNDHLRARGYRQPLLPYEDTVATDTENGADDLENQIAIRSAFSRLLPEEQELLLYKTYRDEQRGNRKYTGSFRIRRTVEDAADPGAVSPIAA
jgi:hypothetical protein